LELKKLQKAWSRLQKKRHLHPGADGVGREAFSARADIIMSRMAKAAMDGTYKPGPVTYFEIDKSRGGTRRIALPQGAPISPALANLYLDVIDEAMDSFDVKFVRYADDFVILCKSRDAAETALKNISGRLTALGLWLHPDKTRISHIDSGFNFLGRLFSTKIWDESLDLDEDGLDASEHEDNAHILETDTEALTAGSVDLDVSPAQLAQLTRKYRGYSYAPPAEDRDSNAPENIESGGEPTETAGLDNLGVIIDDGAVRVSPFPTLYMKDSESRLSVRNQSFSVSRDGQEIWARAAGDIGRIDLGPHTNWTIGALDLAMARDIPVNFCDGRGRLRATLNLPSRHKAKLHLQQAGIVLDEVKSLELARIITAAKIRNQRRVLKRWSGNLQKRKGGAPRAALGSLEGHLAPLDAHAKKVMRAKSINAVLGHEGDAAKRFQRGMSACLKDWTFNVRTRRPAQDPVNAVMNWISSCLTRDMDILVRQSGLHPGFGVLHATNDGRTACVYDLIEEFRAPIIGGLTVTLFNQPVLTRDHFYQLREDLDTGERGGTWLTPEGRSRLIRNYEKFMARKSLKADWSDSRQCWRDMMARQVSNYVKHIRGYQTYSPYSVDF